MSSDYLRQIEWKISTRLVEYEEALQFMEARVQAMIEGQAGPCIWFLEHPPLYTAGTSANGDDVLDKDAFPIYEAGRGGEYTYHGPGQLVAYCMLDLKELFAPNPPDLRAYIRLLEQWVIETLAELGIEGFIREGRVGVWVNRTRYTVLGDIRQPSTEYASPSTEAKIAAIGVRVRKWVTFHGVSINVTPDLSHYAGIVPCGIKEYGVTSMAALGKTDSIAHVINVMQRKLVAIV